MAGLFSSDTMEAALERAGAQSKKCVVATSQDRENTSYGLLTTPDRVQGIEVAADGLVYIMYSAQWKGGTSARAAVFLGSNQLEARATAYTIIQPQNAFATGTSQWEYLMSTNFGLIATRIGTPALADVEDPPTTGVASGVVPAAGEGRFHHEIGGIAIETDASEEAMGPGVLVVERLAAGTYDISVQFKAASGKISVKNRALQVWTKAFA